MSDDQGAFRAFEAALEIDPSYAEAHLNLSFLFAATGNVDKAQEELQLAAQLDESIDLGPLIVRKKKKKGPFRKR